MSERAPPFFGRCIPQSSLKAKVQEISEAKSSSISFIWKGVNALAKVVVTATLLGWLFLHLDYANTQDLFQKSYPGDILLVFTFTLLGTGMGALRWQILLGGLQIRVPFKEICAITFISNFFTHLLPTRIGGEAVRLYYVNKLSKRPAEVIFSILIDRYIGVVALMSMPLTVIVIHRPTSRLHEIVGLVYVAVSAFLLLTMALGLMLNRCLTPLGSEKSEDTPWHALLHSPRSFLHLYAGQTGLLLQTLGISVASHLLNIAIYYHLATSLGERNCGVLDFFYFVPMTVLSTMLPISLGGHGVREWTFVHLFTELGMPRQTALSISLLALLVKIGTSSIGGVLYLAKGISPHE